jgi:hypothetical protein
MQSYPCLPRRPEPNVSPVVYDESISERPQATRQAQSASQPVITVEIIAKRTKRHLDELEV